MDNSRVEQYKNLYYKLTNLMKDYDSLLDIVNNAKIDINNNIVNGEPIDKDILQSVKRDCNEVSFDLSEMIKYCDKQIKNVGEV